MAKSATKKTPIVETTETTETTEKKEKPPVVLTAITTGIPVPTTRRRGSSTVSIFPFDALEVGGSFGLIGRDARSMASVVSNANKRARIEKRDEHGKLVYKTVATPKRDANGDVIMKMIEVPNSMGGTVLVPTSEPEMDVTTEVVLEETKKFLVQDVDPLSDPDGATVRIWRVK